MQRDISIPAVNGYLGEIRLPHDVEPCHNNGPGEMFPMNPPYRWKVAFPVELDCFTEIKSGYMLWGVITGMKFKYYVRHIMTVQ